MKTLYYSLLILVVFSCSKTRSSKNNIIDFVPENTSLIIKTSNFESLKNSLTNNDFLEKLSDDEAYKKLESKLESLKHIHPKGNVLVCLSKNNIDSLEYTIITPFNESVFKTDSIKNYTEETLSYENKTITKSTLNTHSFYGAVVDSTFIISSSKDIISNAFIIKNENIELKKMFSTTTDNKTISIITNPNNTFIKSFFINDSLQPNTFTNYIAVDAEIHPDDILINGITKATDSTKSLINIFKETIPQENLIQNITPSNSDGFMSFTFNNFNTFKTNINAFNNKESTTTLPLLDNIVEIGVIYEDTNRAIVLNSIDIIATKDALLSEQTIIDTYRQIDVFSFSNPTIFSDNFSPLIYFNKASKYCVIDNFFIFSDNIETLQNIIANYQNKTTLNDRSYFKSVKEQLSDASSLMLVTNPTALKSILNKNDINNTNIDLNKYNTSAIQFTYDTNFAHVNGIIKKNKVKGKVNSISEEFNIKLDAALINTPQFVINHRTKQKDIIVQDINNNLYLISNKGKVLWKKQLPDAVLGKIEQIDIYKNGRLQLAFATSNHIHVIDRNGKDVSPFPKKFDTKITQPLSVFDYDKNKSYRLLVTQDKNLLMYDVKAEIVTGFAFTSANSTIISQPKHFRIGNKDYLTFKTSSKLYILDRTGKTRVTPKKSNTYSNEAIYLYKNKFTTTAGNGNLVSVDSNGNVSINNLNLSTNHSIETSSKTLITLTENKLSIKERTIDLDFGNYTKPKLFYLNNKIYVAITDLQSQKAYLYDSQTKLIPNFPVYGNSIIELNNIDKDKNLEFITKGDSNNILLYKIN